MSKFHFSAENAWCYPIKRAIVYRDWRGLMNGMTLSGKGYYDREADKLLLARK